MDPGAVPGGSTIWNLISTRVLCVGAETGSTCVIKIKFVSVRDTVVIRSSIINANDNVQTVAANDNVYVAVGGKIAA